MDSNGTHHYRHYSIAAQAISFIGKALTNLGRIVKNPIASSKGPKQLTNNTGKSAIQPMFSLSSPIGYDIFIIPTEVKTSATMSLKYLMSEGIIASPH